MSDFLAKIRVFLQNGYEESPGRFRCRDGLLQNWSVPVLTLHLQSRPGQETTSELVKQELSSSAKRCPKANSH